MDRISNKPDQIRPPQPTPHDWSWYRSKEQIYVNVETWITYKDDWDDNDDIYSINTNIYTISIKMYIDIILNNNMINLYHEMLDKSNKLDKTTDIDQIIPMNRIKGDKWILLILIQLCYPFYQEMRLKISDKKLQICFIKIP